MVSHLGGKARWRGIPKDQRSRIMREVVRVRWTKGKRGEPR